MTNEDQLAALDKIERWLCSTSEEFILEGCAGSGKTWLATVELPVALERAQKSRELLGMKPLSILYTGTTNLAATNLSPAANTIHKALGLVLINNKLVQKRPVHYKNKLIVVDEYGMLSPAVYNYLKLACENCKILFIGDSYQLPPVKGTCPINVSPENSYRLSVSVRADKADLSQLVKDAEVSVIKNTPLTITTSKNIIALGSKAEQVFKETFSDTKPLERTVVISYTNARVYAYGQKILSYRPPITENAITVVRTASSSKHYPSGQVLSLRLQQVSVDPVVYRVRPDSLFSFEPSCKGTEVVHVNPVEALTIHNSQGSTFDTVFVDLSSISSRRMLYVALTRARKKVYLIGKLNPKLGVIVNGTKG